jgi:hypothetical protein
MNKIEIIYYGEFTEGSAYINDCKKISFGSMEIQGDYLVFYGHSSKEYISSHLRDLEFTPARRIKAIYKLSECNVVFLDFSESLIHEKDKIIKHYDEYNFRLV